MSEAPPSSFALLLDTHGRLHRALVLHQEALIDLDPERARRLLDEHATELALHIREEEEVLLPVFGARAGRIPGGSVELFQAEHRHLLSFVEELRRETAALARSMPDLRRRVIALFDREALYKHLLEHHDLRERNVLYPVLDRVTAPDERARLLDACATTHPPET